MKKMIMVIVAIAAIAGITITALAMPEDIYWYWQMLQKVIVFIWIIKLTNVIGGTYEEV